MPEEGLPPSFQNNFFEQIRKTFSKEKYLTVKGLTGIGRSLSLKFLQIHPNLLLLNSKKNTPLIIYPDLVMLKGYTPKSFFLSLYSKLAELLGEPTTTDNQVLDEIIKTSQDAMEKLEQKNKQDIFLILDPFENFAYSQETEDGPVRKIFDFLEKVSKKIPQRVIFSLDENLEKFNRIIADEKAQKLLNKNVIHFEPLVMVDRQAILNLFMKEEQIFFGPNLQQFIIAQSGGHAGLLKDIARVLNKNKTFNLIPEEKLLVILSLDEKIKTRCQTVIHEMKQNGLENPFSESKLFQLAFQNY